LGRSSARRGCRSACRSTDRGADTGEGWIEQVALNERGAVDEVRDALHTPVEARGVIPNTS
jgi:hypothetical protein